MKKMMPWLIVVLALLVGVLVAFWPGEGKPQKSVPKKLVATNQPKIVGNMVNKGNGTIADDIFQVYWSESFSDKPLTFQEARDYVASLNTGGMSGWRMPTLNEARSIVEDLQKKTAGLKTPERKFNYWVGRAFSEEPLRGWLLEFPMARFDVGNPATKCYVLAVNGAGTEAGQTPPYLEENAVKRSEAAKAVAPILNKGQAKPLMLIGNDLLADMENGLLWAVLSPDKISRNDAEKAAQTFEARGMKGWRLPDLDELQLFMEAAKEADGPLKEWMTKPADFSWSSELGSSTKSIAWHLHIPNGTVNGWDRDTPFCHARVVRALPDLKTLEPMLVGATGWGIARKSGISGDDDGQWGTYAYRIIAGITVLLTLFIGYNLLLPWWRRSPWAGSTIKDSRGGVLISAAVVVGIIVFALVVFLPNEALSGWEMAPENLMAVVLGGIAVLAVASSLFIFARGGMNRTMLGAVAVGVALLLVAAFLVLNSQEKEKTVYDDDLKPVSSQPTKSSSPPQRTLVADPNNPFSDEFDNGQADPRWSHHIKPKPSHRQGWINLTSDMWQKNSAKNFTAETHIAWEPLKGSPNIVLHYPNGKKSLQTVHVKISKGSDKSPVLHTGLMDVKNDGSKSEAITLSRNEVWLRMVCRHGNMETFGSEDGVKWVSLMRNIDVSYFENSSIGVSSWTDDPGGVSIDVDYFRIKADGANGSSPKSTSIPVVLNSNFSDEFDSGKPDPRWKAGDNVIASDQPGWIALKGGSIKQKINSKDFTVATHIRLGRTKSSTNGVLSFSDGKKWIHCKVWELNQKPLLLHSGCSYEIKGATESKTLHLVKDEVWLRLVCRGGIMETLGSMDGFNWLSLQKNIDIRNITNGSVGVETFNEPNDPPIMHVDYFRVNIDAPTGNSNPLSAPSGSGEIIVDNADPGFTASQNWEIGSGPGKYGANYHHRITAFGTGDTAVWNFTVSETRQFEIFAWWSVGSNRSSAAPYVMEHAGGTTVVHKNQQENGGSWQSLGTYNLNAGPNNVKLSCWTDDGFVVIADAVRIVAR